MESGLGAKKLLPDYENMAFTLSCSSSRVSGKENTVQSYLCRGLYCSECQGSAKKKAKTSVKIIVQE